MSEQKQKFEKEFKLFGLNIDDPKMPLKAFGTILAIWFAYGVTTASMFYT